MELYAGNERAHRHVTLPGLEGDVIALPAEGRSGGDLYALFSCGGDRFARIVLADSVGHGFTASRAADQVHHLLHEFHHVKDIAALLAALNDTLASRGEKAPERPRLTTVVTANFDRLTGEFNFAYAAHPRMLLWRTREGRWLPIGEGLENLPLGFIAGEQYRQQSVRLESEDMVIAFSDALEEVRSPAGTLLTADGFLRLATATTSSLPRPVLLHTFCQTLLEAVERYHGAARFQDDLTLLTLRRSA